MWICGKPLQSLEKSKKIDADKLDENEIKDCIDVEIEVEDNYDE